MYSITVVKETKGNHDYENKMLYMPADLKKQTENELNAPPTASSPRYLTDAPIKTDFKLNIVGLASGTDQELRAKPATESSSNSNNNNESPAQEPSPEPDNEHHDTHHEHEPEISEGERNPEVPQTPNQEVAHSLASIII